MAISIKGDWDSKITPVSGPVVSESFEIDDEPDPTTGKITGTYHPKGANDFTINGKYTRGTGTTKDHMKFDGQQIDSGGTKTNRFFRGDVVPVGPDAKTEGGKHHKDILPLVENKREVVDPDDDWSGTHAT